MHDEHRAAPEDAALGERLAARLLELAGVRSVSREERELADLVERELRAHPHLAVEHIGDNLLCRPRGGAGGPEVLLCGHLDTVPPAGEFPPPRRDGDRIEGLGTADLKAGLAVLLELAAALPPARLRKHPTWLLYAREELGFAESGLEELVARHSELRSVAFAVCVEPTANTVELGCLGTLHARVRVHGRAAHSARPWQGKNAIHAALPLLQRIAALPVRDYRPPAFPELLFREVLSATQIQGGRARNVIPDRVEINLNFRFAPDRTPEDAMAVLSELVGDDGEVEFVDLAPPGRPAAPELLCRQLLALAGTHRAKQAWTDVGRLSAWGVDAVSFGPGAPEQAHQAGEYASVQAMVQHYRVLEHFLTRDPETPA